MQITIDVPEPLGQQLQAFQDRLPEVLTRGLQELLNEQSRTYQDEQEIMSLLASQPTPEQILAIRPSPELQTHLSELLAQSKAGTLSRQSEAELERYLTLEHLVRLAKAHAYQQLQQA
jgi:3-methyladenine DNA glycosylase/8-oxoguanine DNA glycosylase